MTGIALRFFACLAALPLAEYFLPGVHAVYPETAWIAGALLALVYLILRPVLRLVLAAGNCLTLGILGIILDTALVWGCTRLFPDFTVDGFWWAAASAVIVSVMRNAADMITERQKKARKRSRYGKK